MKKLLLFFMSLFTFLSYGQLSENFEGAVFPPTGWTTFQNGIGLTRQWTTTTATALNWVHTGAGKSAIIFKEDVPTGIAEDWMVTPLVTVPANGQLRFFARSTATGEQGSIYKVKISTASQNNPADFTTTLATYTELDIINAYPFEQKTISLAAYANQTVYIAFVMENDNGDAWVIDNINVNEICNAPSALLATPSNTSANLSWTYTGPATQFSIEYGPAGFTPGTGTIVSPVSNPYNLTGLNPSTNYKYYVRALCGVDNPSPLSTSANFTTTLCALSDRCDFIFRLTDDFGDGWNNGTIQVRQAGTVIATLGGGFTTAGPFDVIVPLCSNQPYELFWNNGGSWPDEMGIEVIDPIYGSVFTMPFDSQALVNTIIFSGNAFCTPPTCPRPTGVTITAITQTQASINWTLGGAETQWEVLVLPANAPAPTAATPGWQTTSTRPYLYTGLTGGTQYKAYVRAICNPGVDESVASGGVIFATQISNDNCVDAILAPVNPNTSCSLTIGGTILGATASTPASTCAGTADDDVWFKFVATSTDHNISFLNVSGSTTDLMHVLYSGTCGSLTRLYCSDPNASTATGLTVGQTYFIRVYSWTGTVGQTTTFDLCIRTPASCSDALAFCGDVGLVYPNSAGTEGYGGIGCLGSTPNPSWFYMQVNQSGNLNFQIAQTDTAGFGIDVDYIMWGPFTEAQFSTSCANLYGFPSGNTSVPNNVASCSYSAVSVENFTITNAIAGNIYIVLITNYSDDIGTVTFTQTGGTGSTDCSIVCNLDLGPDRTLCDTPSYQIVSSNTTADNYQWYFNNVLIPGVNSSTISVSQTGTYKCVITCGINQVEDQIVLTFNTSAPPTFNTIAPFCVNTTAPTLPTISTNGIPGSWSPSVISNTASGNYTFTPDTGICASPLTISVTVNPVTVPSFISPAPVCSGGTAPVLPGTSNNGISGTWFPAVVDNMNSATYTFTPTTGQCASTVTLDVQVLATCTFSTIASAVLIDNCNTSASGEFFNTTAGTQTIGAVSNVFTNSDLGTYVQASGGLIFNGAELRTFKTLTSNVCGANLYYRIYNATATPGAFTVVNLALLESCAAGTYPTGGTCSSGDQRWQNITPAIDLTTYPVGNYIVEVYYDVTGDNNSTVDCDDTILLNNGGANYKANFTIQSTPTFAFTNPTSCNGTQGSITVSGFSPGDTYGVSYTQDSTPVGPTNYIANVSGNIIISNLPAGVYTGFNFVINGCTIADATVITLVNPVSNPTFNQVGPFCVGDAIILPTTSIEGYTGTWSPPVDNTQTTTYTFTPTAGQCATVNSSYVVTVNETPSLTSVTATTPVCFGQDVVFTIVGSPNTTLKYNLNSGTAQTIPIPASGSVTITVTAPAAGNVILNLLDIDNGACNVTLTNSTTVVVKPMPTVTSLTAINSGICSGSDAEFTIQGTPNSTVSYQVNSGPIQTAPLNASGQSGTITITAPTTDVVIQLVSILDGTCDTILSNTITIKVTSVPVPTINITALPTCAVQTATFEVLSPLSSITNVPSDLFISEVTDEPTGSSSPSLSYIEIYNGTGAPVDLSNYKLKIYTSATPGCTPTLSGILANDDVVVIKLTNDANMGGVVPDLSFPCGGFNNNDRVVLTTITDVEVDSWGIQGTTFTPLGLAGYNYRRNTTAPLASTIWDPADWTEIDWEAGTEDYSNVGSYTLYTSNYEYILSNGTTTPTTQTTTEFTGVTPGTYTLVAHDLMTGCYSQPYTFTIAPFIYAAPVLTFTYVTPVCNADTVNPLPNTSIAGFSTGGTFTANSSNIVINSTTGEVDLATSFPGTYTITYTLLPNVTNCINGGTSEFILVINEFETPTFNDVEVCIGSQFQLPTQSIEGYNGTWSPAVADVSTLGATTYYFTPNNATCSQVGELIITVKGCTIPKGISPNGDGLNDTWDLSGFDVENVQIFNRYGKEVYSKSNYSNEWNGKSDNGNELPDGTYYYVIKFNDMSSRTGWIYINREQ